MPLGALEYAALARRARDVAESPSGHEGPAACLPHPRHTCRTPGGVRLATSNNYRGLTPQTFPIQGSRRAGREPVGCREGSGTPAPRSIPNKCRARPPRDRQPQPQADEQTAHASALAPRPWCRSLESRRRLPQRRSWDSVARSSWGGSRPSDGWLWPTQLVVYMGVKQLQNLVSARLDGQLVRGFIDLAR